MRFRHFLLFGFTLCTCLAPAFSQQDVAPPLFSPVPAHQFTRFHTDHAALRQRNVFLDDRLFAGDSTQQSTSQWVNLNLFSDTQVRAHYLTTERAYGGGYVVRYSIGDNDWDYAAFSIVNEAVSGVVHLGERVFTIGNVGQGELTVSELDASQFLPCDADIFMRNRPSSQRSSGGQGTQASGDTADILIPFTTDVTAAEGGLDGVNSLANLAVSEMNHALAQGDSPLRVNLVHTYQTNYVQSGNQSTDLARMLGMADGYMDEVHILRDTYSADFVHMFIANYGSGVGVVNYDGTTAFAPDAFSLSRNTRSASSYTLAHELGHNMGLLHDRANNTATQELTSYGYGWETANPTGFTYGSVMSYPGFRRPIYSNPGILAPNDWPMGVLGSEDASLHIANYYSSYVDFRSGGLLRHKVKTVFDGSDGAAGNMFNILPKTDISLDSIAINTRIAAGSTATIDIWFRKGSWVGFDHSSTGWTLLDSLTATSAGFNLPTVFDFGSVAQSRTFLGNQTYGFYVDLTNGAPGDLRYTPGVRTHEDSFLRIESGAGKGRGGFTGNTHQDFVWNGIIFYRGGDGANQVTTSMNGNINGRNGNMFDVRTFTNFTISSFDVNVDVPANTVVTADVWYRPSTFLGHEDNPEGWTFVGSDTKAVSAGPGSFTRIAVGDIPLVRNNRYGFYIRIGGGDNIIYEMGSGSFSNSDLEIVTGAGLGGSNAFKTLHPDRTWNGRINYRPSGDLPRLTISNFIAGNSATLSVANCTPGRSVVNAYSFAGGGPTQTIFGMAELSYPWFFLPNITADALGHGSLPLSIPPNSQGVQIWLQSLDFWTGELTNGVSTTVQ